ncbi:hypothetical protein [Lysinibacillus fusiformis]
MDRMPKVADRKLKLADRKPKPTDRAKKVKMTHHSFYATLF